MNRASPGALWRRLPRRRLLFATTGAGVILVAVVAVLVVNGQDGSSDVRVPGGNAAPSVSTTETPTSVPTTPGSGSASSPALSLADAAVLSDQFMATEFGQGRRATRLPPYSSRLLGAIDTCYYTVGVGSTRRPRQISARTWYWPDEVVATEVLAREPSPTAAEQRFATCSNPNDPSFDRDASVKGRVGSPTVEGLDIGDESFVVRVSYPLYTAFYSGARVGADLVLVNLRQSGSTDALGALRHALRAAVAKAEGRGELSPVPAPAQQPPPAMSPFLTQEAMPGSRGAALTQWRYDVRAATSRLDCNGSPVAVAEPSLTRYWSPPVDGNDVPDSVRLSIAHAADQAAAHTAFDQCASTLGTSESVPGLGDEAARGERGLGIPDGLVIRVGGTVLYLEVKYHSDKEWTEALGRAALHAYLAAHV